MKLNFKHNLKHKLYDKILFIITVRSRRKHLR